MQKEYYYEKGKMYPKFAQISNKKKGIIKGDKILNNKQKKRVKKNDTLQELLIEDRKNYQESQHRIVSGEPANKVILEYIRKGDLMSNQMMQGLIKTEKICNSKPIKKRILEK